MPKRKRAIVKVGATSLLLFGYTTTTRISNLGLFQFVSLRRGGKIAVTSLYPSGKLYFFPFLVRRTKLENSFSDPGRRDEQSSVLFQPDERSFAGL